MAFEKREEDYKRLHEMGEDEVERVLSSVNTFSEALKTLGVGRKAFMMWVTRFPEREATLGRKRARPIWEM